MPQQLVQIRQEIKVPLDSTYLSASRVVCPRVDREDVVFVRVGQGGRVEQAAEGMVGFGSGWVTVRTGGRFRQAAISDVSPTER